MNFYCRNEEDRKFDSDMKALFTGKDAGENDKQMVLYLQNQAILSLLRELNDKVCRQDIQRRIIHRL